MHPQLVRACVCVCVCACVRACLRVCLRACVRVRGLTATANGLADDVTIMEGLGSDAGDYEAHARRMGYMTDSGSFADAFLFKVWTEIVQHLCGVRVPIVQLNAVPPEDPSRWTFQSITGEQWVDGSANPGVALVAFNEEHWNPVPGDRGLPRLATPTLDLEELWKMAHALVVYCPESELPPVWTSFKTFATLRVDDVSVAMLLTRDVRLVVDSEQEVPRTVLQALLSSGWQLTWTRKQSPISITRPIDTDRDTFILPPLDAATPYTLEMVRTFLTNFLFRASGGLYTLHLGVVLPILDGTTFVTLVLSPRFVTTHTLSAAPAPGSDGQGLRTLVQLVTTVWQRTILPPLWRQVDQRRLRGNQQAKVTAAHPDKLTARHVTHEYDFTSRCVTISALAVYYACVYDVRHNGHPDEIDHMVSHARAGVQCSPLCLLACYLPRCISCALDLH